MIRTKIHILTLVVPEILGRRFSLREFDTEDELDSRHFPR